MPDPFALIYLRSFSMLSKLVLKPIFILFWDTPLPPYFKIPFVNDFDSSLDFGQPILFNSYTFFNSSAFFLRLAIIYIPFDSRVGFNLTDYRNFLSSCPLFRDYLNEYCLSFLLKKFIRNYLMELIICWWRALSYYSGISSYYPSLSDPPSLKSSLSCLSYSFLSFAIASYCLSYSIKSLAFLESPLKGFYYIFSLVLYLVGDILITLVWKLPVRLCDFYTFCFLLTLFPLSSLSFCFLTCLDISSSYMRSI